VGEPESRRIGESESPRVGEWNCRTVEQRRVGERDSGISG